MQVKDLQLKRALCIALLILLLGVAGMTKGYAYDFSAVCSTGQTLYYNITNAEYHYVELTCPGNYGWYGYDKPAGDIVLPTTVYDENDNQYYVTSIGSYAFRDCSDLTGSLIIPNTVVTIGGYAFQQCSGFTGSLSFPNFVTTIGQYAFWRCSGFTGDLTIGNSVTYISGQAFSNCTGFTSVYIPSSVTGIHINPFFGCSGLEQIIVDTANPNYDSREGCNAIIETNTNKLIAGCKNSIIFDGVTIIGYGAFFGCSGLVGNLSIPNTVVTIETEAFSDCVGLTGNLTIPNSVTAIGGYAFTGCTGFTGDLIIPNSVTSLGYDAFWGCTGFDGELIIPNTLTSIEEGVFGECSGLSGSLNIPNSVTTIGDAAFQHCVGFTGNLVIPNSVTTLEYGAFLGCTGFTGPLIIPNSMSTISASVFRECNGFTGALTIPNSVIEIGNYAFEGCTGFNGNLTLGSSLTTIGNHAFDGLNGFMGNLIIPNSVNEIGENAFRNCIGFTGDLLIGSSVTSIDDFAFYGCTGISSVILFPNTPPTIGWHTFDDSNNGFKIYVPYEFLEDYKAARYWSNHQAIIYPWMQKSFSGYGNSNGGWHFIASPVLSNINLTEVYGMILETNYDLYRFNQSAELEWENYKNPDHTEGFTINNRKGYLYASEEDVNLMFKGVFNEFEEQRVTLVYDATATFAGWNLVGNPFPVSAYANRSYYVMNEEGTAIEPVAVSMETAIPACTGVMVKADAAGESVTFSKTAPEAAVNRGVLQIALSQVVEPVETPIYRGDGPSTSSGTLTMDKAIVSFNAGDALEKFVFNDENAQLYIPQDGKDYAIVCAEKQGEMPLNFKAAKNGNNTLAVNTENMEMEYLHLVDNLTGNDIDLLVTPSYTFEAKTTDYASRFKLVLCLRRTMLRQAQRPLSIMPMEDWSSQA